MKDPSIAIAATFTAEPLRTSIAFWMQKLHLPLKVEFAPYNQVFQQLLDPSSLLSTNEEGVNVILIRFEDWVRPESFPRKTAPDLAKIERSITELVLALRSATSRSTMPYLVCICPDAPAQAGVSSGRSREKMEDLLLAELHGMNNVHAVPTSELAATYPVSEYYDAHADELAHIPFTPPFFTSLGTMVARRLHGIKSTPFKVIALDCDQTLWKGVCGEDGTFGIEIDGPRKALQEFMVEQHDAGMLICLCSKNNEEDVLDVFAHRIEMPLKRQHIVSWRINWEPKSKNIISLAEELQVGLDSFIFIDDSPVECAEVQSNCPEVLTLQLPQESSNLTRFLQHAWAFDHLKVTEEDRKRTTLYKQNIARQRFEARSLSLEEFLAGLELKVDISETTPDQVARVAQLTQRTNQFNATTVRYSEGQIQKICESGESNCLVANVSDRFGDYGLVGVIIFKNDSSALKVDTFLLSCRVLGRGVEHRLIARLGEIASERGLGWVEVPYIPTGKNRPMLRFLESVGAPLKQPANLFRLPAEFARQLTYSMETVGSGAGGNGENERPASGQKSGVTGEVENKSTRLREIANELYDADVILRVIESHKQRSRPALESTFVEPRNPSEKALAEIWAKFLDMNEVGIKDNFFEVGGDSLLAVGLLIEVEKVTGKKLGVGALYQAPTIEQLAKILHQEQGSSPWASLVPIQPNGAKPPFFFLAGRHHVGDRLGPDQPVYRVVYQDLEREQPLVRIEDMAAHSIKSVRTIQPEGPYYLGGHGLGGVVAFEIAQQLQREGEKVALLTLCESWAPGARRPAPSTSSAYRLWQRVSYSFHRARRIGASQALAGLLRGLKKKTQRTAWHRQGGPRTRSRQGHRAAAYEALRHYVPQVYAGRITVVRGTERVAWREDDALHGWGRLATDGVDAYEIPGSHTRIYKEPNVGMLARTLNDVLHQAQARVERERGALADPRVLAVPSTSVGDLQKIALAEEKKLYPR
jgi:FkbH-like protein